MNEEKKARLLEAISADEKKIGRKMVLRRRLAAVNPNLVEAQKTFNQIISEDDPLDGKSVALVNLAAALATRAPMCIRNNMTAARAAGLSAEEIGSVMAHAHFITGTAALSASLEGLEAILGPLES